MVNNNNNNNNNDNIISSIILTYIYNHVCLWNVVGAS